MRSFRQTAMSVVVAFVSVAAGVAGAQTDSTAFSPLEIAVACAPPPSNGGPPANPLRLVGSQDTVPRTLFGARDLLVIDGGTNNGVLLGQQFFVRRGNRFGVTAVDAQALPSSLRSSSALMKSCRYDTTSWSRKSQRITCDARATLCAAEPDPPGSAAASARPVPGASASATSIAAAAARRPTATEPRRRTRGGAAGSQADGLPSSMLRPGPAFRT